MRQFLLSIFIISSAFFATPVFGAETTGQKAVVWLPIAKANILLGKEYFQTTRQAIQEAKESIYVAMYLINVEPTPTDNPASILLEGLINAKKRGVHVKVILDDTTFKVNYNAYKRLQQAGIDVLIDSTKAVLHGKGLVIDSKICILGSFNWSRASLYDNYEFATYIEGPQQAKKLLDYITKIELSPQPPIQPAAAPGPKFPVSLLTAVPFVPGFPGFFIEHSENALDLYLYLIKKAHSQNSNRIEINNEEFAKALGYSSKYYSHVYKPLKRLIHMGLVQRKILSKYLILKDIPTKACITIPDVYWDYGFCGKLSFEAKYMYLISLNEAIMSPRNPYWFRSQEDLVRIYGISVIPLIHAINELEQKNILEVYRQKPDETASFKDRLVNRYRLNPLESSEQFSQALSSLSAKYGASLTAQAQGLSAQLNEPNDLEKIKTYIELINTYGYEKVREVNSKVALYHKETGFRDLSQVILLLKSVK
ncbi:MAG: phospholipase D-like domain-containing protein [Candidatus Omnitrophica bacterium]|nr:phospholipase D-like domain-containing protein [Candidatus Omnitrophota bacterium]